MSCQIKNCAGYFFPCHCRYPHFDFGGIGVRFSGYEGLKSKEAKDADIMIGVIGT